MILKNLSDRLLLKPFLLPMTNKAVFKNFSGVGGWGERFTDEQFTALVLYLNFS